ncbi:RelA/SpoT domain-containing protein [Shewanella submarina]|uniref:RelA/SpoT domain-containing protein n=1 Tax=Shewanella submarina TaxID=2016376 RepID=A0ABV7G6F7_9GAMM|nr:RelA/SpoT domain-containing protein [Shewanella submarina]MCL1039403.1 RelA/SpoT domain-containing protein [Shewanella submarina]
MNKLFRSLLVLMVVLSAKAGIAAPVGLTLTTLLSAPAHHQTQRPAPGWDRLGLTQLRRSGDHNTCQSSSDLNTLYLDAPHAQAELTQLLYLTAENSRTQPIVGQIKSRERAEQKVAGKLEGDASRLTDIVRGSIIADSLEDLMASFHQLEQQARVVQLKNRFAEPKRSGYRDLNLLVELPETGMIAEVQLHLRKIADIKSGIEHQVYQEVQGIEYRASQQSRALTELERARIVRLQQDSHKLYHKAWLHYKRQDEQLKVA